MTANGVGTRTADAVVCIDTTMFPGAHLDALRECRRILAPGGRIALTSWEATNPADERNSQWARRIELMRDLTEAGFERVDVADKPVWREAERDLWESAIQADASGDPAIRRSSPCTRKLAGPSNCLTSRAGFARRPLRRANGDQVKPGFVGLRPPAWRTGRPARLDRVSGYAGPGRPPIPAVKGQSDRAGNPCRLCR